MSKEKNTITINGVDYTLRPGMKAIVVFEKLTDDSFRIKNTTDILTYIYAAIIAGTPDAKLDFSEMLDAFDDPALFQQASDIVLPRTSAEKLVQLANEDEGGTAPKKD